MKVGDKHSNIPSQSENGFPFKQITLLGMTILDRELQRENAPSPILTTLLGITMLVKEVHVENALLHIILVPSLTEYPPLSSLGASNSFLPSLLYFTPRSSIKASFNSSSVISVDKSSIV